VAGPGWNDAIVRAATVVVPVERNVIRGAVMLVLRRNSGLAASSVRAMPGLSADAPAGALPVVRQRQSPTAFTKQWDVMRSAFRRPAAPSQRRMIQEGLVAWFSGYADALH
jgi:hypothetical protein